MSELKEAIPPKKYAKEFYGNCPNCGCGQVEGKNIDIASGDVGITEMHQPMTCTECPAVWTDIYVLDRYQNPEGFTNPIPAEVTCRRGDKSYEKYMSDYSGDVPTFTDKKYRELDSRIERLKSEYSEKVRN